MKQLLEKLGIRDRESFWQFAVQFLKFGLVGAANTLIHLGVYYLLLWFGWHYLAANSLGYLVGLGNSYFWNSRFVFGKTKTKGSTTFLKMSVSYGATFLLSNGLMVVWISLLHLSQWIAPILNLLITVPLNFLLNKFWAFR